MTANLLTKSDLQQTSLVDIDRLHKKVMTNSLQVAAHFNKRPSEINRRISVLGKKGLCRIAPSYYLNQQGKQQKYYELNRDQFLLVVMGFTGDKADRFKTDFIRLFNQQEEELIEWRQQRHIASDTTKQANDQVYLLQKDLAEVIPSSKRCTMLFVHIQQAITKAVTGSAKTERGAMTADQLYQVGLVEQRMQAEIKRLRSDGVSPEEIRDDVMTIIKTTSKKEAPVSDQTERNLHDAA